MTGCRCICLQQFALCTALICLGGFAPAQEIYAPDRAGGDVLTRGPVHEAFAEPVVFDPQPGETVPRQPPAAVAELPPEQRPSGANVAWIPGYWDWDEERNDFMWISGIWRIMPPNRQWIPGYWASEGQGATWVSGYWAAVSVTENRYLPVPPETLENGPNVPQPAGDYIWLPGTWIWQETDYVWRPGYWGQANPDWIWVPAHYVWTPLGCVFIDGYWDLPVQRRGVLFAPVYFSTPVYAAADFYYTPTYAIDLTMLTVHLFCHPRHRHYYFGDYYAGGYRDRGFVPWFAFHGSRRGFDPIFAHHRWSHRRHDHGRDDHDWEQRLVRDFEDRRDREESRPPRTLAAARERFSRPGGQSTGDLRLARPLTELVSTQGQTLRFDRLNQEQRRGIGRQGEEVRRFREERQKVEARGPDRNADDDKKGAPPKRVQLPRSPVAARPADPVNRPENRGRADSTTRPGLPDRARQELPMPDIGRKDRAPDADKNAVPREDPRTLPRPQPTPPPQPGPNPRGKVDPRPLPRVDDNTPPQRGGGQPGPRKDDRGPDRGDKRGPDTTDIQRPPQNPAQPVPQPQPPRGGQGRGDAGPGRQPSVPDRVPGIVPRNEQPRPNLRVDPPPQRPPQVEQPRPAPRVEQPKPAPRIEQPKPAPRVEQPKPAPRAEPPKPAPRAEPPKPPRVDKPKPPPRAEPPKNPKQSGGGDRPDKGKKKDKD